MNKNRLAKVITWRITSIVITMLMMIAIMGDVKEASKVTAILHCLLTAVHYMFESLWERYHESWR